MNRKHILSFLTASCMVLVLSLGACIKQEPSGMNVICLVDLSDSGEALQRKTFYMKIIRDVVIPKLGLHDAITVIPIDDASVTNSAAIFRADLSSQDFEPEFASPMEVDSLVQKKMREYKAELASDFETSYRQVLEKRASYGNATDLFGAIEQGGKLCDKKKRNVIIFFSDMMNYTDALKMEPGNSSFNNNSLEDALKRAPVHSLPGSIALVLTGELSDISTDHFRLVNSFWSSYFKRNGIALYDYSSTSTQKLEELLQEGR